MHSTRSAVLAAVLLALGAGAAAAAPRERAEDFYTLPYDGRMPQCDDGVSLFEITQRFASAEAFTFNSPLRITGFNDIREYAFRANGAEFIPRRYCVAKASFNDSRVRTIKYTIIERGGLMSFNRGVDWCVVGLDRYRAYSPLCDVVGP
ncbi:hypothetical protein [Rhodoblastus sp.]|uniref:hypothetical protein n=1 Tax=Rhodoblastus sp. TaxID=1962975 RepID=UPI003F9814D6